MLASTRPSPSLLSLPFEAVILQESSWVSFKALNPPLLSKTGWRFHGSHSDPKPSNVPRFGEGWGAKERQSLTPPKPSLGGVPRTRWCSWSSYRSTRRMGHEGASQTLKPLRSPSSLTLRSPLLSPHGQVTLKSDQELAIVDVLRESTWVSWNAVGALLNMHRTFVPMWRVTANLLLND